MSTAVSVQAQAPEDPLANASQEELQACARLLAASIAHHRAKFGAVPLADASDGLRGTQRSCDEAALHTQATAAVAEALRLVRAAHAEPPASAARRVFDETDDRRRQLRIAVNAPVRVTDLDGARVHRAMLRNISWGGAAVRCDAELGGVKEHVRLLLPTGRRQHIVIVAEILRRTALDDGYEFALRFDSLTPEDHERLEQVLRILLETPGNAGRRAEARLVQRLEIEYGDAGELRATLEDISASGLMLTVPEALEVDQSLLVALSSADTVLSLNLRARIVHQAPVEDGGIGLHRVGLEFEHPSPELRRRISAVIRELALVRPAATTGRLHEDPPRGA